MGERRSTQPAKRGEWPRPAEGEGARTARLQPSRSLNCLWLLARGGPYVPRPRLVRVADAEEGAVVLRRRHETDPIFCEAGRRRGARGLRRGGREKGACRPADPASNPDTSPSGDDGGGKIRVCAVATAGQPLYELEQPKRLRTNDFSCAVQ